MNNNERNASTLEFTDEIMEQHANSVDVSVNVTQLASKMSKIIQSIKKFKNMLFIAAGFISLGIGIVGIVIPLLPTFPFLLLTLFCFSRGSDKFTNWFKSTKIYQNYLESFILTRSMTLRSKIMTLAGIIALISIPMILRDVLVMRIVLFLIIVMHFYIFFYRVKTVTKDELKELVIQGRQREKLAREEHAASTEQQNN